ncbi:MAG: phage scaffolding protein [Clostridium sp.]
MKTELLKELGLTEEQIKSVMAENGKDIEAEKAKATTLTNELEGTKLKLEDANSTIKSLKTSNKDNEELQKKVKEYEEEIKTKETDYVTKVRKLAIDNAITKELVGCKYSDLVRKEYKTEGLEFNDDGSIKNLDVLSNQTKLFKEESYKDMFSADTTTYQYNPAGGKLDANTSPASFVSIIQENQSKR